MGEFSDDETFAQYMLEEDIPESLPSCIYIDWEATARNLMYHLMQLMLNSLLLRENFLKSQHSPKVEFKCLSRRVVLR